MNKTNIFKLLICIISIGLFSGSFTYVEAAKPKKQTIYEGIWIDGVDVGGLTKEAALEEYKEYIEGIEDLELTFKTILGDYSLPLGDIDISVSLKEAVDEAYNYGRQGNILKRYKSIKELEEEKVVLVPKKTFDKEILTEKLKKDTKDLTQEPKNATIKRVDGEFIIHDEEYGQIIEVDKTVKAVEKLFSKEWKQEDIEMNAVVIEKKPKYTAEDFYGVDSVIGRFKTEYNQENANRSKNLAVGASKISGTVLMPGEQFSVYKVLSPFTEENGYENAGQYVNNEVVDGIGGGICQVASTLYNAVLLAELEVDERYPHSLTVGYVKLSRDATIAGDYMDFKFTNSTEHPIYIDAYAGGGQISFALYGHESRPDNRSIDFETKVIKTIEPPEPEETEDDTLEIGEEEIDQEAHTGYYTELWKHIYVDGKLEDSVRVNRSQYQAHPAKIRVGTKEVEEEKPDEPAVEPGDPNVETIPTEQPTEPSGEVSIEASTEAVNP